MNKKIKKNLATVMAVGILTVGSLGTVAYASGNPYENFKAAAVETMKTDNMTVSASLQMKQNGAVIAQGDTLMQVAGNDSYSLSNFKIGDNTVSTEQSNKDGALITRQGDKYFSTNIGNKERDKNVIQESPNMVKLMEMTTDLLIGDVKNQFVANGDTITLNLTDAQIPELANVAMGAFTEMKGNYEAEKFNHNVDGKFDANLKNIFPVTQNVKIDSVNVNAKISDGRISDISINFVITGQDKDGKTVSFESSLNGNVTAINTTSPQQIDTAGKTVTERNFREHE